MNLIKKLFSIKKQDAKYYMNFFGIKCKISTYKHSYRYWRFNHIKKRKGINNAMDFFLKEYLDIVPKLVTEELKKFPQEEINISSDYVWTMWAQEEQPEIVQACLNSIKKIFPNVIIINDNNIDKYIEIPTYIKEKYNAGIISKTHFSDYVRVYLLDKFGGYWFDATCLAFSEIPQCIKSQNFVIPVDINKNGVSNWFIKSNKNNYFIKSLRIYLEQYWQNEDFVVDYFFLHHFVTRYHKLDLTAEQIWDNMPLILNHQCWLILNNLSKNFDTYYYNWIKDNNFVQKLTYKNKNAFKNPNSYYWHIIKEYKKEKYEK